MYVGQEEASGLDNGWFSKGRKAPLHWGYVYLSGDQYDKRINKEKQVLLQNCDLFFTFFPSNIL